jgi:hypothetical protein
VLTFLVVAFFRALNIGRKKGPILGMKQLRSANVARIASYLDKAKARPEDSRGQRLIPKP